MKGIIMYIQMYQKWPNNRQRPRGPNSGTHRLSMRDSRETKKERAPVDVCKKCYITLRRELEEKEENYMKKGIYGENSTSED